MNVLIVGGAGYLGSHVARVLSSLGEQVTVFDNLTYQDEYRNPYAHFVFGDVMDTTATRLALLQADIVVWLAAIVGDAACAADPARAIVVNQEAVKLLAGCGKPAVFASSCSAYGALDGEADESAPLNPLSLYAETKIRAEQHLAGTPTVILRLGTLHGESDRMRFDLVVNGMTRDAVAHGVVHVYGGHQRRPLLAVQDAAEFIALQVMAEVPKPDVYNLASENLTIAEVGERVADHTGASLVTVAAESQDQRDYVVSTQKARKLGFNPTRGVQDSIIDIAQLIRSQRVKDPYAPRYTNASRFT